jgi:hypothetical protein
MLDSKTRKKKFKQLEQQLRLGDDRIHPQAPSQYVTDATLPIRQYFHSKTMQPMTIGEWDIDSDDEADEEWAHILSDCALKELGDVSPKEKIFMNKWNRFMTNHSVIADDIVAQKCTEFLIKFHKFLFDNDLRDQFLLHLLNLWDNRLIPSFKIIELMRHYDTSTLEMESCVNETRGIDLDVVNPKDVKTSCYNRVSMEDEVSDEIFCSHKRRRYSWENIIYSTRTQHRKRSTQEFIWPH